MWSVIEQSGNKRYKIMLVYKSSQQYIARKEEQRI